MNSERQEAKKIYELWFAAQTEPRIRIIVALFGMERKLNSRIGNQIKYCERRSRTNVQ